MTSTQAWALTPRKRRQNHIDVERSLRAALRQANAAKAELLDALKRAARDIEEICQDQQSKVDPSFALDRVRAAIAKATNAG